MHKTLRILTAAAILTLATFPLSAAIYMKVDGVDGRVTAAGKEKWIELDSIQFMTAGTAQGMTNQNLDKVCTSRVPLPTVSVEINGESHTLRNVQFTKCQTAGKTTNFTVGFSDPRVPLPKTYDHKLGGGSFVANATIAGLTPARTSVRLLSMKVRGNKATVLIAVPPAGLPRDRESSAPSVSEIVVTKIADATSWSYAGSHILYQDVTIPASARGSFRVIELTIDFESMKGSRADYVDPDSPIPAGR
jgi:hypothetical protein